MENNKSPRVLFIAFHYPPILQSSGVHRTAKFVQYLPEFDWQPYVLSAHPRAFSVVDPNFSVADDSCVVKRAFALDTAKHLSIFGRYPGWLALPDRWVTWSLGAIPVGLYMIKRYRPKFIFSTYPIATTHLIAYFLHKLTGIPWVADFRDPMTDTDYPTNPTLKRIYSWIEKKAITHSIHNIFTTPDSRIMYEMRYPNISKDRHSVITNGYDEEIFSKIESSTNINRKNDSPSKKLILVHAGALYRLERDPIPFFNALADLLAEGIISEQSLAIKLRASGSEDYYNPLIKKLKLEHIVFLESSLGYEAALTEMINADGLLLFQAANCNHQIPAKVYEYLRAKTPIFSLTDRDGNTAKILMEAGITSIANIEKKDEIKLEFCKFLNQVRDKTWVSASQKIIGKYSRKNRTNDLANLLNKLNA